jgi:thiol:disulfide interchange protein
MKIKTAVTAFLLLCSLAALAFLPRLIHAGESPKGPKIYDESADGQTQITDALKIAHKESKCVLLDFGANWCPWCHKLHHLFESDKDIAGELDRNYVVVMVDVNEGHNASVDLKYGNPIHFGLPVLVVLDSAGERLTTKKTGELEEGDHHNPAKVMEFLQTWAPKRKNGGA